MNNIYTTPTNNHQSTEGYTTPQRNLQLDNVLATPPSDHGEEEAQIPDPEFIVNLQQEGDLERLTRKATEEGKGAWRRELMDKIRKQVESIETDEWLFK